MYDRPSAPELIGATRAHLEENIIPVAKATNFKLYFQTLVAINVLKIVEREYQCHDAHLLQEGARLLALMGNESDLPASTPALEAWVSTQNARLCEAIRVGEWDEGERVAGLFEHLKARTIAQLEVANPKYLAMLVEEDAGGV